jgi:uncharacterized protein (TIGR03067 family)
MKRQLLGPASLACLLVLLSQAAADQSERSDNTETVVVAGQLRGTWVAVSMEQGGRKEQAPKDRELVFTFDAGKLIIIEGKHTEEGSYTINEAKALKEIDLIPPMGIKEATIKGIYQIDGDTLKLAFNRGGARPTGFDGKDNDGGVIIFKRKK